MVEEFEMTVVEKAVEFAVKAHEDAKRKSKDRPYILHPLEAMVIVSALTDDEEIMVAAVLHDTIEDAGITKDEIAAEFGERVAELVAAESENKREGQDPKKTWKIRKEEALAHLAASDRAAKLICLGDKLANLREIARDHRRIGDAIWQNFNQKDKKLQEWYYGSIYDTLRAEFGDIPELTEYRSLLMELFVPVIE